ncbi:MAG TPA: cupin domain-containing protein [Pyrinomonadaceae bacterium]|nr:cupin domain-containing protein [Pyrinomonadaceae bacterium]
MAFTAERAWGALDVAEIEGATVRLHWTNAPYHWHTNDGAEVFVVLAGEVDMHYRVDGVEQVAHLKTGDIFHVGVGEEHYAAPIGAARVLVVERAGSV